jgi:hypothetical protein
MYQFRLQRTDGSPAEPPTFQSSTLNWRQGDKIYLTGERTLRCWASVTTTPTSRRRWSLRRGLKSV